MNLTREKLLQIANELKPKEPLAIGIVCASDVYETLKTSEHCYPNISPQPQEFDIYGVSIFVDYKMKKGTAEIYNSDQRLQLQIRLKGLKY